jgi:predicted nucleotidyltransferase
MLSENDILRISRRIVEGCAPLAVGTFGSYAIGTAHEQSDLDVFVISKAAGDPAARTLAVKRLLFGILHPLDVFVFTPEEFEEAACEEQSFTWVIVRQARIYHWTEEASHLLPSLLPKAAQSNLCPPNARCRDA